MNKQYILEQFQGEIDDDDRDWAISDLFVHMYGWIDSDWGLTLALFIRSGIDNEVPAQQISNNEDIYKALYSVIPDDKSIFPILGCDFLLCMFLASYDEAVIIDKLALVEFCDTVKIDMERE